MTSVPTDACRPAADTPAATRATPGRLARDTLTDPVIWLLVGLGLLIRLGAGWLLSGRPLIGDEAEYLAAARVLADGRGFGYYDAAPWLRPPAYPVLLAALLRLPATIDGTLPVLQLGLSLAQGPAIAWIGWLATGRRAVARWAAGLTLALLPLAVLPWLALTETLFTLLLVLGFGAVLARLQGGRTGWLVGAAGCLAGACLLRGVGVGAVALAIAVVAIWGGDGRRRLRDSVLLAAVVIAVISPWAGRNWLAYRAIIPLETTGAYNLWLRAQGGRGASWMVSELLEQANPAARQAHAMQRATALIAADPWAYVARGWRELGDVVRVNAGAAERFTTGYSAGEVSRRWLALTLALDDVLYLALLPLAALGLALRGGPLRWLTIGWLAWTALLAVVFFAITRFRAPALPLLALQAAIVLVDWRLARDGLRAGAPVVWAGALAGVLAVVVAASGLDPRVYLDGWRQRDGWHIAAAADRQRLAGAAAGALATLAATNVESSTTAIARGLALAALGRSGEAEATLAPYPPDGRTLVALGEIRRLAGDPAGAARAWSTREVDGANPLPWAWGRLNEPARRVDVGDGGDLGLVRGMHAPERDGARRFRWTDGQGAARLRVDAPCQGRLAARLRGYRPAGRLTPVTMSVNGRALGGAVVGHDWVTVETPVTLEAGEVVVELVSDVFVPGYADARPLGVMVDWIEVCQAGASVSPPHDRRGAEAHE